MKSLLFGVLLFFVSSKAYAYPHYRRLAMSNYSAEIGCELCHAGPSSTERNAYGRAWHDRGENAAAFATLSDLDTDGDGVTNITEIKATSNPSDERSTPTNPGKYAKRAHDTPIPREQLELVSAHVRRFEVVEPVFDDAQLARLKTNLGREPGLSERMPTIYLAVRDDKPEEAIVFSQTGDGAKSLAILVAAGIDGKVKKIAVYRSARTDARALQAYIQCYTGLSRNQIAPDKPIACSSPAPAIAGTVSTAVHDALVTIWTAFGH